MKNSLLSFDAANEDKGIKLNREKLQLRLKEVAYMGHVLSADGLQPDPEKVKAIREMPTPTDKQSISAS